MDPGCDASTVAASGTVVKRASAVPAPGLGGTE